MQEFNIESFSDFIKTTLFEVMSVDDYILVIEELFGIRPTKTTSSFITYHSFCHHEYERQGGENLSLKIDTMMFTCYSHCGSMDLLKLVQTRYELINEPKKPYKCMQLICQACGIPFEFNANEELKPIDYDWKRELGKYTRKGKKSIDNSEVKVYNDDVLEYFKGTYASEWLDYGISKETMDKFEIGYYTYRNQITIPVRDRNGLLRGIRIRNMDEKLIEEWYPRYVPLTLLDSTTYKFPTNSVMYGECQNEEEIKRRKEAWIVESEKSTLKLDTLMNGKGIALGMMGSALSDDNVRYILSLEINKLVILADSDFHEMSDEDEDWIKFEQKILKLCDKFTPFVKVEVVFNNVGIKDAYKWSVTDFTIDEFKEMYKNRVKVN